MRMRIMNDWIQRILLVLMSVTCLAFGTEVAADEQEQPPNIIFILADDMGYNDLSIVGQHNFETPELDRMAREGMLFTQHYAGSTVCAPSRATLLTGNHTGRVYQRGNGDVAFRRDPHDITIATRLKKAGYHTAMIGKSGLSCKSDDLTLPNDKGFDHFFGFIDHVAAHRYYPTELVRNGEKIRYPDNHGKHGKRYSGDLLLDEALRYLVRQRNGPFFLHLALQQPHADLAVPEQFREPFVDRFEEKPHPEGRHYRGESQPAATYAGMVRYVDYSVGKVLDQLRQLDIDEKTLVIFSSDNGSHREGGYHHRMHQSNAPLRGGKRDLYEGGIRVPAVMWWPGTIKAGTRSDHVSAFWDFAPTALQLAGLRVPEEMDGISYLPTLLNQEKRQRDHEFLYWEFYEGGGSQAVRYGDWKGLRLNLARDRNAPIQLFNLREDIGEKNNIADQHPKIVNQIRQFMDQAHKPSERFRF